MDGERERGRERGRGQIYTFPWASHTSNLTQKNKLP